jgi:peptide/nickel transport system substrate-binding protein
MVGTGISNVARRWSRAGILFLCFALPCRAGLFGESPDLAEKVARGELPPVAQRLPANPQIVQPTDSIGKYGGTLRMAVLGWSDLAWLDRTMGNESLVRWDPQWTQIIPNIAQSWTVNSNATEYVFHLRQGLRWSDGEPFTADDIMFWYDDIFSPGIAHPPVAWLRANGKPVRVEKRDEFTVAFIFAMPNGLLLYGLAGLQGDDPVSYPKHYLARFHPKYNREGLPALLNEAGTTNWMQFFRAKIGSMPDKNPMNRSRAPELPRMCAWQFVPGHGYAQTSTVEAVRNPYYWKLDTAGRQLPYIDRLVYRSATNAQELVAMALRGEIDFGERAMTSYENLPRLQGHEKEVGFHFVRVITDSGNLAAISLNMTHLDPFKRQLYRNKDFRIGLSHAIHRDRIIRDVLKQPGVPCQVAPCPGSLLYHEQLAKQYTEYDVAKANEFLDRAGLTNRDDQGWRIGLDGKKLTITAEVSSAHGIRIAAMKFVKEDWAAVGVDLQLKLEESGAMSASRIKNQHDAMVWGGDGGLDVVMDARYYLPVSDESTYGTAWARWMLNPADKLAEKPPPLVEEQMRIFRQVQASPDAAGRQQLMRRVLDLAAEEFPVIGLCTADDIELLVSDRLQNVPRLMMSSGRSFLAPAPTNPSQYYFDPPEAPSR